MTAAPDTILVTGEVLQQVSAGDVLVTPSGGTQQSLADALAAAGGGGGPIAATTLTASSTVTLSPASHNVTMAPTGTGEVIINPATAGTMDNMAVGGTTPKAGAFTTLSATSTVSGAGITALFASPPAIGGTAAAAGKFTTITSATNKALTLTSQVDGAGVGTGTLTNAPAAGDPNFWLPISLNGTDYWIPAWHA